MHIEAKKQGLKALIAQMYKMMAGHADPEETPTDEEGVEHEAGETPTEETAEHAGDSAEVPGAPLSLKDIIKSEMKKSSRLPPSGKGSVMVAMQAKMKPKAKKYG